MAYKGKFTPANAEKYIGDISKIRWLSLWERAVMKWLDKNTDVVRWGSEIVKIRYHCETDQKSHLYLIDFYVEFTDGRRLLVEVKPSAQTTPPKQMNTEPSHISGARNRRRAKYLKEAKTYIKNMSKWKAAADFAKKNGMSFEIWTEQQLKNNLGLKITR